MAAFPERVFSERISVLVADSTPMGCQLVSDAIRKHNHLRVIASALSSSEIVSVVRKQQPDVALISVDLQDGAFAGLLALRELRTLQTRSRAVLVLDNDERELVVEAFLNHARGVFCRIGSTGDLRKCIQSVHNGEIWITNLQMEYIVEALMRTPSRARSNSKAIAVLSKREEEIARLVATGLSNRDVSDRLRLSPHTVKNCLSRIFEKLGISTRTELVLHFLSQRGLCENAAQLAADTPCEERA